LALSDLGTDRSSSLLKRRGVKTSCSIKKSSGKGSPWIWKVQAVPVAHCTTVSYKTDNENQESNHCIIAPNFGVVGMPNHGLQFPHWMVFPADSLQTNFGRPVGNANHSISNALVHELLSFGLVQVLECRVGIGEDARQGVPIWSA
jgi:hypothetical protein